MPSPIELGAILAELPSRIRAAAVVMITRGLRVGALPELSIRGGRFTTRSKGKDLSGELPSEGLAAVKGLGSKPFAELTAAQIADTYRYATAKLFKAGKLAARYSVHGLRHYFALAEYRARSDLYRLKTLLGHASTGVTEAYLRGLGEI